MTTKKFEQLYKTVKKELQSECSNIRYFNKLFFRQMLQAIQSDNYTEIFTTDLYNKSVTGNGSGSYTMNRVKAEENINNNWDLFSEALDNFGDSFNHYIYGNTLDFEKIDIVIRCYVLRHTINVVVDELKEQFKEEL